MTTTAFAMDSTTSRSSSACSQQSQSNYQAYRPNENGSSRSAFQPIDPKYLPGGEKSLSGISIRSFLLGQAAGTCAVLSLSLLFYSNSLWRIPFFVATLALFHFLEYFITARYNNTFATISAFLLTQNGAGYNIAHGSAFTECLLTRLLLPESYFEWTAVIFGGVRIQILLGLLFMVVGQTVRSLAMVQAGVGFTHTIQEHRRDEHRLVKTGIYSILRHPSYFGFFWWGLGTQLVLGNTVCLLGYAVVLWKFFSSRIKKEEKLLIDFFGEEYVEYQGNSWVGIPGIS